HGDVLMWLMKTLLTSGCTNQRGAGQCGFVSRRRESGDDARVHKTGYAVCKYLPSCSSIHDTK
ncbi:hypothetical protein B8065_09790, partial [Enterobacter hormaechei subsp. xiangfangensis]